MIRKRNNKRLYESIMKDVAKTIKRNLNESNIDLENTLTESFKFLIGKKIALNIDKDFLQEHVKPITSSIGGLVQEAYDKVLCLYAEHYIINYLKNYSLNLNVQINENNIIKIIEPYDKWDYEDSNSGFKAIIKVYEGSSFNSLGIATEPNISKEQYKKLNKTDYFILIKVSIDYNFNIIIEDVYVKQKKDLNITPIKQGCKIYGLPK